MMKVMDHNQVEVITGDCSMGVELQTLMSEDDDHPPSSRCTRGCALNNVILAAVIRKA